jgi:hypothetical protein
MNTRNDDRRRGHPSRTSEQQSTRQRATDQEVQKWISRQHGFVPESAFVSAALHSNSMIDKFAPRFKVATRAVGMTDVLSPHQVRTFSDCEVRWFYEHLLGLPDPPTANLALDKAVRAALMINFRHKLDSKEDIETEGVVGLFRLEWKKQLASAIFCADEVPETIGTKGERLVREYMERVAPKIWPAALHQPLHGVIGAVRIRAEVDLIDVEGTIIDIRTSQSARMDQMHRFELATGARLAPGASVVRSYSPPALRSLSHACGKLPQLTCNGRMHYIRWRNTPCSAVTICRIGIQGIAAGINVPTGRRCPGYRAFDRLRGVRIAARQKLGNTEVESHACPFLTGRALGGRLLTPPCFKQRCFAGGDPCCLG